MTAERETIVLMADDDEDDRNLVKEAFEQLELECYLHFADDGRELMDYLLHRGKYEEPPKVLPSPI